jgi:hypothetical protein
MYEIGYDSVGLKKIPILNSQRMGTTDRYLWRKKAIILLLYTDAERVGLAGLTNNVLKV